MRYISCWFDITLRWSMADESEHWVEGKKLSLKSCVVYQVVAHMWTVLWYFRLLPSTSERYDAQQLLFGVHVAATCQLLTLTAHRRRKNSFPTSGSETIRGKRWMQRYCTGLGTLCKTAVGKHSYVSHSVSAAGRSNGTLAKIGHLSSCHTPYQRPTCTATYEDNHWSHAGSKHECVGVSVCLCSPPVAVM